MISRYQNLLLEKASRERMRNRVFVDRIPPRHQMEDKAELELIDAENVLLLM